MVDLNGQEILRLTGKQPVIYSDLRKYKDIDQLLGKEGFIVVLYQTSSYSVGHWVAITRNDNTGMIRYCDSYGIPTPLQEIQYTPFDEKLPAYLDHLLDGVNYESNRFDYQARTKGISTCGRWSSIFCIMRNKSLAEIQRIFTTNKLAFFNDYDNCATILTLLSLDEFK